MKEFQDLVDYLRNQKLTISFAESVSAGLVANEFSKQLDVGDVLIGSIVSYHTSCKEELLGVKKSTIKKHTAESQETTDEMAKGLKNLLNTDICVATTGLATPGGSETTEKPVGTVFISVLYKQKLYRFKNRFYGTRDQIIQQIVALVFFELRQMLMN
jgi:nicotinamide-nucleotide amidase